MTSVEIIKLSSDISLRELGITLKPLPQEAEKQAVMQAAMQALQAGRDGSPTINMADYIMIQRMVGAGDSKMAEAQLGHLIQKRKAESDKVSQQMMQQQQEGNMQLKQAEQQALQMKIQMETESKIAIE